MMMYSISGRKLIKRNIVKMEYAHQINHPYEILHATQETHIVLHACILEGCLS